MKTIRMAIAASFVALVSAQAAEGGGENAPRGPRRGPPPPEAYQACSSKAAGDTCSVTHDGRTMNGSCRNGPDSRLVCAPSHPMGPPPEAFQACANKSDGDACSVEHDGRSMKGTCRAGGPENKRACVPEGMGPGGGPGGQGPGGGGR